ncbi:transcriptional regulator NanR [Pacificispira spongiicola]|uniref:transcriptional regulator NanR n=1 Tax=Pacificispira spongiicola TaxID=2729598 RepID=UPI001D0C1355|nr:transcriptional regulator NanR [Pacificispira spongiicola]
MTRREALDLAGDKVVRRKLSDLVLEKLMGMIRGGEIAPGEAMPSERDLMERFGVGRPAVREALQTLETMGFISISHGERARVLPLTADTAMRQIDEVARMLLSSSPENLEHLKEARRFFEIGMVRIAATRVRPEDIGILRDLVDTQRAALGDATAFIAADMAFHRKIAELSGNPIFAAVSVALLDWLFQYHAELLLWTGGEEKTLVEHGIIVDNLAAGDPEGAAAAMGAHLDRSDTLYRHRDDN